MQVSDLFLLQLSYILIFVPAFNEKLSSNDDLHTDSLTGFEPLFTGESICPANSVVQIVALPQFRTCRKIGGEQSNYHFTCQAR